MKLSSADLKKLNTLQGELDKIRQPLMGMGGVQYSMYKIQGDTNTSLALDDPKQSNILAVNTGNTIGEGTIKATYKRWVLAVKKAEDEKLTEAVSQQAKIIFAIRKISASDLDAETHEIATNRINTEIPASLEVLKKRMQGLFASVKKFPTVASLENSQEAKDVENAVKKTGGDISKEKVAEIVQDAVSNKAIVEKKTSTSYLKYFVIAIFVVVAIVMYKMFKK